MPPRLPPTPTPGRAAALAIATLASLSACGGGGEQGRARESAASDTPRNAITGMFSQTPDQLPVLLNPEPPFRYPPSLYAQRVQGNVVLRLFVDTAGVVVPDSTRIQESSGNAVLDSTALAGVQALRFSPARRRGTPIAVALLYPVYFRHPEAAPLPGDSLLHRP